MNRGEREGLSTATEKITTKTGMMVMVISTFSCHDAVNLNQTALVVGPLVPGTQHIMCD